MCIATAYIDGRPSCPPFQSAHRATHSIIPSSASLDPVLNVQVIRREKACDVGSEKISLILHCVQIIECVCPTSNRGLRRTSSTYAAKVGVRNTYSAQELIGLILSLLHLYTIRVVNLASLRLRLCFPLCGAQLGGIVYKPFLFQWHVFVSSTFSVVLSIAARIFLYCSTFAVVATVAVNQSFQ